MVAVGVVCESLTPLLQCSATAVVWSGESPPMATSFTSIASSVGPALARVVVPMWVLSGAAFKLIERTPSNLPGSFLAVARQWDVDLWLLLRTLIGLEFLAVAVMVLVARLARPMAIFMLLSFCLILIVELVRQSTSCGCFGSIKIHPGVMLGIDGTLLAGVIFLRPPRIPAVARRPIVAAAAAIAGGFGLAYGLPEKPAVAPPGNSTQVTVPSNPQVGGAAADCTIPPALAPLPPWWYAKEIDTWPGKCCNELELFAIIGTWPSELARGRKHVVFYRRDCDHCQEMFENYFAGQLDTPVIAYRIPSEVTWQMPQTTATLLDLSDRCDWVIETPLIITLQDGRIECAREGLGFEECLE